MGNRTVGCCLVVAALLLHGCAQKAIVLDPGPVPFADAADTGQGASAWSLWVEAARDARVVADKAIQVGADAGRGRATDPVGGGQQHVEEARALVDARPHDMYTGAVVRHAVQAGHIPGALNVVSLDGTDGQSQKWLPEDRLAELYKAVPKDKTVYLYCHDGFRMSLGWVQLRSLGYQDVRVVNGGWGIWDRAFTLPVVTGETPYDNEFAL